MVGDWSRPDQDYSNLGLVMEVNGRAIEIGSTAAILGNPSRSLLAAARLAGRLEAGGIILAGGGKPSLLLLDEIASVPIPVVKQFGVRLLERIDVFYAMSLGLAFAPSPPPGLFCARASASASLRMRDNEEAAGSAGVDLVKTRILCFLMTAPFLGLAGVMTALEKLKVAPSASFNITDWTIDIIFIVVIGGIGSLEGPIVSAVVFSRCGNAWRASAPGI